MPIPNTNNNSKNYNHDNQFCARAVPPPIMSFPDMLESIHDSQQRSRLLSIQSSIRHAWSGYQSTILNPYQSSLSRFFGTSLPADDLEPLTNTGKTWLHSAATLFDSLDTLYLAGLYNEYEAAVNLVLSLPLPMHPTKTFEYSIRILGGLLGAYTVSSDERLLDYAEFVADGMLDGAFRSSPTVLPRMFDVVAPVLGKLYGDLNKNNNSNNNKNNKKKRWRRNVRWVDWGGAWVHRMYAALYRYGRDRMGQHEMNSLAGVGSFALEFTYLSYLTGDTRYKQASDDIFEFVQLHTGGESRRSRSRSRIGDQDVGVIKGLIDKQWNIMTGHPLANGPMVVGLGSGSDSYYEYLIKSAILLQPLVEEIDVKKVKSYAKVIDESFFTGNDSSPTSGLFVLQESEAAKVTAFPVQYGYEYDHLLCYVPGMIALGEKYYVHHHHNLHSSRVMMELGMNLTLGCRKTYKETETNLGPERLEFHRGNKKVVIRNGGYFLRPEYVESLFVMYRSTRDEKYRDMAWEVFQSLEKYCKYDLGYTSLRSVHSVKNNTYNRINEMPSYFIAETLKYLLLIYAPVDYIGLDEFVFTTEAHPLRQLHTMTTKPSGSGSCERQGPIIHQPIANILVLVFYNIVLIVCYIVMKRFRRMSHKNHNKKRQ